MQWMNNSVNTVMEKSLDGLWQRSRAISENIANATTPGYKRKEVAFEDLLAAKINSLDNVQSRSRSMQDLASVEPKVYVDDTTTMNADGNNVDLDQEFLMLTDTGIAYQYVERLLNDSFGRLRYAITEGRG